MIVSHEHTLVIIVNYSLDDYNVVSIYHIRTNIGGYNIWRFVEIMDLMRY